MHFLLSGNVGVAAREIPSCMEIFFILSAGEVEVMSIQKKYALGEDK